MSKKVSAAEEALWETLDESPMSPAEVVAKYFPKHPGFTQAALEQAIGAALANRQVKLNGEGKMEMTWKDENDF